MNELIKKHALLSTLWFKRADEFKLDEAPIDVIIEAEEIAYYHLDMYHMFTTIDEVGVVS